MVATTADLARTLIERIEAAHPAPAVFVAEEVAEWRDCGLATLLKAGLLQETQRASTVICDGCEWSCVKAVVVRKKNSGAGTAFVTCDEAPDLGRIAVPLERLAQYRSTIGMMAQFLAKALDISLKPKLEHAASIRLGSIKGRYGDRVVYLELCNRRLDIRVGRQREAGCPLPPMGQCKSSF